MKRSRNHKYRGALAEPMNMHPSELSQRDRKLEAARISERLDKLALLCDDFGIDRAKPGWKRDLALNLIFRHCSPRVSEQGVSVGEVFTEDGVDPSGENADFELALCLAGRYVPGFEVKWPPMPFGRLSRREFAFLAVAAQAVNDHFRVHGRPISDRSIATALRNPKLLQSLMEPFVAAEVCRILNGGGNSSRGARRSLSDRTLRGYLRLAREAMAAHKAGVPTRLQRDIAEAVIGYSQKA